MDITHDPITYAAVLASSGGPLVGEVIEFGSSLPLIQDGTKKYLRSGYRVSVPGPKFDTLKGRVAFTDILKSQSLNASISALETQVAATSTHFFFSSGNESFIYRILKADIAKDVAWTPIAISTPAKRLVAYGDKLYIAKVAGYEESTDNGATWTPRSYPASLSFHPTLGDFSICPFNGYLYFWAGGASGAFSVYESQDGVNWATRGNGTVGSSFNARFVFDGKGWWGLQITPSQGLFKSSPTSASLLSLPSGVLFTYDGEFYAVVSDGTVTTITRNSAGAPVTPSAAQSVIPKLASGITGVEVSSGARDTLLTITTKGGYGPSPLGVWPNAQANVTQTRMYDAHMHGFVYANKASTNSKYVNVGIQSFDLGIPESGNKYLRIE